MIVFAGISQTALASSGCKAAAETFVDTFFIDSLLAKANSDHYVADTATLLGFRENYKGISRGQVSNFKERAQYLRDEYLYSKKIQRQGITIEEAVAVLDYTQGDFENVNRFLRGLDILDSESPVEIVYRVALVRSALNKLPKYEGEVYRVSHMSVKRLKIYQDALVSGMPIERPAFVSTSEFDSIFLNYDEMGIGTDKIPNAHLYIESKTGRSISGLSGVEEESEVLIPHGKKFKVSSIKEIKADQEFGDYFKIYLEEL